MLAQLGFFLVAEYFSYSIFESIPLTVLIWRIFWIGLMSSLLLKPQIPAFTVPQLSEAMDVLQETAREQMVIWPSSVHVVWDRSCFGHVIICTHVNLCDGKISPYYFFAWYHPIACGDHMAGEIPDAYLSLLLNFNLKPEFSHTTCHASLIRWREWFSLCMLFHSISKYNYGYVNI